MNNQLLTNKQAVLSPALFLQRKSEDGGPVTPAPMLEAVTAAQEERPKLALDDASATAHSEAKRAKLDTLGGLIDERICSGGISSAQAHNLIESPSPQSTPVPQNGRSSADPTMFSLVVNNLPKFLTSNAVKKLIAKIEGESMGKAFATSESVASTAANVRTLSDFKVKKAPKWDHAYLQFKVLLSMRKCGGG